MKNNSFQKRLLASGSALQVLAMAGGGLAVASIAAPAAAQDYTRGTLQGTVLAADGSALSGAEVTVRSNEQGFSSTTTTDASGGFRVTSLPTGTYTVIVRSGGTVVVEDRSATVVAGQNNTFRYTAAGGEASAGAGNVLVVTGTRQRVNDFAATQTGVNLDVEKIAETVPVGRSQTSLILLAPQTTSGDSGFGNLASIGGATVAENTYYVNGLNITNFRDFLGGARVPFEFYQTLDVKTGGYAPEYGRALGGVTSAVTKSGSNNFKAGAVVIYSPDELKSTSPNTYSAYNDGDYSESLDANFYLSGPIIKDRLFFYALYNPGFSKSSSSGYLSGQTVESRSDSPFFGGKLDFVIADGHRLEGTYFRDKRTTDYRYSNFDPTTETTLDPYGQEQVTVGGDNFIGTYAGRFTDWFTLSASYGQYHDQYNNTLEPTLAYVTSNLTPSGAFALQQGVSGSLFNQKDERKVYRIDADIYANLLGEHHFRFGYDREDMNASEFTRRAGAQNYTYQIYSGGFTIREYYYNEGAFETKQSAFYAQDSWTLPGDRLNLQLGVRADRFKNSNQAGDVFYDSDWVFAPRLGASFDVFGDQQTKLNAFYGRYILPVATNTNIRLAGAETYYSQIFANPGNTDADGDGIPDAFIFDANGDITNLGANLSDSFRDPSVPINCPAPNQGEDCYSLTGNGQLKDSSTTVSQGLKPSEVEEIILGVTHRMSDWTFGLSYTRRRLLETLEDSAIDAAAIDYCVSEGNSLADCNSVWTGYHQYVLNNPGSDVTVVLDGTNTDTGVTVAVPSTPVTLAAADVGYPKASRNYDAIAFTAEKAFNGTYGFNFNYTWTRLRGNFEGGVKSDINQTDTGLTQDFDQPGFLDGAYGSLANEREHSFKLYGYVEPVKWFSLGVNALLESPRKFSCIGVYKNDSSTFEYYYRAASYYCRQPEFGGDPTTPVGGGTGSVLVPRGSAFESEWNKRVDLSLTFKPFEDDLPGSRFTVDIFNVFNWKSELDYREIGDIYRAGVDPNYKKVTGYQAPRSVRLTWAMRFGGN